ncbi:MAG: glycosyltransferase family 4 protein [Candidatus Aminicenantales bacterium]
MKILMLAPEPFFQPRGTPISVYFRIKALADLGHEIHLITYPLGGHVDLKNFKAFRIPNLFPIRSIKIGPSLAKIPLDSLLFLKAFSILVRNRYDLIFSHEEAALFGAILGKLFSVPHIYDMHSSLPQQLDNFKFSRSRVLKSLFLLMENYILKSSQAVIVICQDLMELVRKKGHGQKVILIENFIDFNDFEKQTFSESELQQKKSELAPHGEKIFLYAGNFESYQGVPLLLEAAAKLKEKAVFLLVGGNPPEIEKMKKMADSLRIKDRVIFIRKVPPAQVPVYLSLADVLVSPRLSGTNTPLKIYSFLKSGKPLVATNLWTHTQVLSRKISILVEPNPESFAEGMALAISSPEAQARACAAKDLSQKEYTYPRYLERMEECIKNATVRFHHL